MQITSSAGKAMSGRWLLANPLGQFIEGILVFSHTHREPVEQVQEVLELLENRLFVKVEKCKFHVTKTTFFSFLIEKGKLCPDPAKVKAVWREDQPVLEVSPWPPLQVASRRLVAHYTSLYPIKQIINPSAIRLRLLAALRVHLPHPSFKTSGRDFHLLASLMVNLSLTSQKCPHFAH